MSSPSIILETEHLLMRPFVDDDKEHYIAMMSHHDVHTWLGNRALPPHERILTLMNYFNHQYDIHGYGVSAIIAKSTGHRIGAMQVHYIVNLCNPSNILMHFILIFGGMVMRKK